ncbi:hypothetical protein DY000_02025375 [Brassica cretica]|uniref:F-box domain-containing protein n=1 Tax=Brassica cretica TaxID=69181 RepID=A0ABQ7EKF4_BRACR|nr:hypothetical protein DY000_02025375 [Brassica cretica]
MFFLGIEISVKRFGERVRFKYRTDVFNHIQGRQQRERLTNKQTKSGIIIILTVSVSVSAFENPNVGGPNKLVIPFVVWIFPSSCLRNRDRISELPDALLLQILSFVPTKDAVATSVLSKRWRYLCKMMPRLRFWYERTDDLERFSDNVCRFLLSHQAPVLQSLHLEVNFERGSTMDIGVLLGVAFGLHVRELELQVYSWEPYRFPTSLYKCRTLETLKLGSRVLLDVSFPVCLKALRTLSLFDVSYKDDGSVVNLLSGCSVLENLEVMMFSHPHLGTFTIHVPSLQNLTLISDSEDFTVFVINAPHLKYLNLKGLIDEDSCLIENTPEVVEAHITDVSSVVYENIHGSLTSVKRLSLKIASPLKLTKFNRIFNQLVCLEIHTYEPEWWNLLMLMLDSSPNLQVLKLISEWFRILDRLTYKRWSQPKYVAECLVNRLETLVWENYEGGIEDDREVAQYMLSNASRLETATFSRTDILHTEKRLEGLKELESVVKASNSCQLVFT